MKLNTFKIKYSIFCALAFPVVARLNFYNTGIEYGLNRYVAPFLVGGISGFLIGLMKDRWSEINKNLELKVQEKTKDLNNKISELKTSQLKSIQLIKDMETTLEEVKTLSGLLPICAQCKKVRDDNGYWNQIERYIEGHSKAQFSHSICPECTKKLYPLYPESEMFEATARHLGVGDVYEEDDGQKDRDKAPSPGDALTPEALAQFPDDLRKELKQAILELDVDLIQVVIERIRDVNTIVADGLADLANNYQYEKILALI